MDYILLKICARRWQVQYQGINVSQRVLDLLKRYDTNLSSKCRVSSGPWKPSNESSGLWKPRHLYDTLPWILKTLEYAFLWWSWKPWNKTFHKQKRNNHQKLENCDANILFYALAEILTLKKLDLDQHSDVNSVKNGKN